MFETEKIKEVENESQDSKNSEIEIEDVIRKLSTTQDEIFKTLNQNLREINSKDSYIVT